MIIIFHYLYIIANHYIKLLRKMPKNDTTFKSVDAEENIVFDPPVYKQRYGEVQLILLNNRWIEDIRKVVDFGCAEMKLFSFINRLHRINEILAVDVDENLLTENLFRVEPVTVDYLSIRTEPLNVYVLQGSISDPDERLTDVDAVIGIEIVEHLYPDTLEALPYNVFGFIKPKLALFTTPNADFNVLFPNFKGMRHFDHKFEWTREQFEMWCNNIVERFPNYSVSFKGIGEGPNGTQHLGCCSQMAVFIKNEIETECIMDSDSSFGICTYHSNSNVASIKKGENSYYNLIKRIEFPYEKDERTVRQKISDDLQYKIGLVSNLSSRFYNEDRNRLEIPVVELIYNLYTHFTSVTEACAILTEVGYKIEECLVYDQLMICVVHEPEMENVSSSSNTLSDDFDHNLDHNHDHYEWHAITSDPESDWGATSDTQKDDQQIFDASTNAQELIYDIIDHLETDNVENSVVCSVIDETPSVTSESTNQMCDSGYGLSSLNLTSSAHSYLDGVFDIVHDQQTVNKLSDNSVTNDSLESEEDYKQNKSGLGYQNDISKSTIGAIPNVKLPTSLNCANETLSASNSMINAVPGTSVKTEEKPLHEQKSIYEPFVEVDIDDKAEAQVNCLEAYAVFEEVENGDLANNNRDLEGNNYPNAADNQQHNNDNQNAVLQENRHERNDDDENRNQIEEYPIVVEAEPIQYHNEPIDLEIQFSSREALFDSNSQEDLLDDYDVAADGDQSVVEVRDQNIEPLRPEIIFVGLDAIENNEQVGPILAVNAEPFPNWLLNLLGAEIVDDAEVHDEPHFYCQGDGVGVHPSFVEDDDYEEETSSDRTLSSDNSQTTSSEGRSNDDAEAEPSVSEIDVGSLPEDLTDSTSPTQPLRIINVPQSVTLQEKKVEDKSELPISCPAGSSSGTASPDEFFDTIDESLAPANTISQKHINDPKSKKK